MSSVKELVASPNFQNAVKNRLGCLLKQADRAMRHNGRLGPEIGIIREQIIISLFRTQAGKDNVKSHNTLGHEVDVTVFGEDISIKTVTNNASIKACWTTDYIKVEQFVKTFIPRSSLVLINITKKDCYFYYIPMHVYAGIAQVMGAEFLHVLPKGTNNRGVEFSRNAIDLMKSHDDTIKIIFDADLDEQYDPYAYWDTQW